MRPPDGRYSLDWRTSGPARTLILISNPTLDCKTPHKSPPGWDTVLRALGSYGPLCLAKQYSCSFLLHLNSVSEIQFGAKRTEPDVQYQEQHVESCNRPGRNYYTTEISKMIHITASHHPAPEKYIEHLSTQHRFSLTSSAEPPGRRPHVLLTAGIPPGDSDGLGESHIIQTGPTGDLWRGVQCK